MKPAKRGGFAGSTAGQSAKRGGFAGSIRGLRVKAVIHRWLSRAFGPASVSLTSMAIIAPLGIILAVLLVPHGSMSTAEVWAWSAFSQAAFTVVALGLPRIVRARSPLPRAVCVATAGALRGLLITWGMTFAGMNWPPLSDSFLRCLHSAVACTLWVGFCGVLLQGGRDFRASYRSLMAQSITLQRAASNGELPPELRTRWEDISVSLGHAADEAQAYLSSPTVSADDLRSAADVIAIAVEGNLRDESHSLWRSAALEPPRLRWQELLIAILDPWAPPVRLIMAVYGSLLLLGSLTRSGILLAVLFAFLLVGQVAVLLLASRWIARRIPRHQIAVGITTLLLMPLVLFAVSTTIGQGLLKAPADRGGVAIAAVSAALVCWTVLIYQRLANERQILLTSLRARLDAQVLAVVADQRQSAVLHAQLGTFVHHSLSSEMTALHLQLRQAAEEDDPIAHDRARRTANRRLLGLQTLSPPWDSALVGREHMVQVAQSWEGIAVIDVDLAPEHAVRPDQWNVAALVMEEAVAGAVRSGGARHVIVSAQAEGEELLLSVADDGAGVAPEVVPGLGTAWLEQYFVDAWSRQSEGGGSRLSVRIA